MDDNRELRSMLFSVIHLPPLPAIVCRVDRDDNTVLEDEAVESSHSIIGSMLEWTAMANNRAANEDRMKLQLALISVFKSDLTKIDPANCPAEDLYNFYCHHTRAWLNTYSSIGSKLLFKPSDHVLKKDKMHQNMQGYTKAQYHIFSDGEKTLELSDDVSFTDLLRKCALWTKEAYEKDRTVADNTTNTDLNNNAKNDFNTPSGTMTPIDDPVSFSAALGVEVD